MKYPILVTLLLFPSAYIFAQKPPIDSSVYGKWPHVDGGNISNDGKYVTYSVSASQNKDGYSILKSVHGNWEMKGLGFSFTWDGRFAYFMGAGDTLCKVALGGDIVERIPGATGYQLIPEGPIQWLIYWIKGANGKIVMQNLSTGSVKKYSDVKNYQFSEDGKTLLLQSASKVDSHERYELTNVDLSDSHSISIWKGGEEANNICLDTLNHQLFFSTHMKAVENDVTSYWYYKAGSEKASVLISDDDLGGLKKDFKLGGRAWFSKGGDRLFFWLTEKVKDSLKPLAEAVPVEVWSYRDEKLQSQQTWELKESSSRDYLAVLFIADHRIIRLQQNNDADMQIPPIGKMAGDFATVVNKFPARKDKDGIVRNLNEGEIDMVSTKNGSRKLIKRVKLDEWPDYFVSPEGEYIIFYGAHTRDYFSYDTHSGFIRNITQGIPNTHIRAQDRPDDYDQTGFTVIGWFKGDSSLLLWDQYDIWEVALTGNKLPINLTNGYGRKHNLSLQIGWSWSKPVVRTNEKLLLYAFNRTNKENGFYWLTIGKKEDPELITMGSYIYDYPNNDLEIRGEAVHKARDADAWLVKRMSARESANYFWTNDLKKFIPVSDVHPEKNWNWATTELINWKTPDGSMSQGILYKPENFDPKKKYPIIFYYYERLSDGLNACLVPGLSEGELNILWYVSNGYLVFTPDIYYKIGEPFHSSVNYVVSAANYLRKKMPWIDPTRMGLQGHSFGAIQTNYIITHSHLFAAACSASGLSDLISEHGSIDGEGRSEEFICETGQNRIGATPWQRPDLYIKNSAIFRANEVTTPLLIMHTTNDGVCPLANIEEFYIALWRLKKPVWMLLYGDAAHSVVGKSGVDFTIRMQQFFDYYLKGASAPKWMVEGIPARMKGVETGLELEESKIK